MTFGSSAGLHYIGQLHENSLLRIAFDQLTEGQLEFQQLKQHFDTIHIGLDHHKRAYTILSGKTEMKEHLKKQFPEDTEAIETFFKIMKVPRRPGATSTPPLLLTFCPPPDLGQEDPLLGHSEADPSVGFSVPAQVWSGQPGLSGLPPVGDVGH